MNVLIVGGSKGSWHMRGRQLGAAMGARVTTRPNATDWATADVIVLVKHAVDTWFREAKTSKAALIWDVLDYWPQPTGNQRDEHDLVREILQVRDTLKIHQLIAATEAMATAIGGVYLPHHHRIGLSPAPVRSELQVVAYEGSPRYLGSWRVALEQVCARLGLSFVVNPRELGQADLLVAFRGEQWDGWACRQWKSGIKYVNAIAAGRPILTQHSAAFGEILPPGLIVEHPEALGLAIEYFAPRDRRESALQRARKKVDEFSVDRIAKRYQAILQSAVGVAA